MSKFIYEKGEGELVEKKSRFLSVILPVESEEEALAFIAAKKKEHWNASHNCYAYIIGKQQEIMRCSDDGEPSQTAGKPMLDVLLGGKLYNVLAIVTRYFGGTLLGTGGLVRAYSKAVREGLAKAVVLEQMEGVQVSIRTDYNGAGKIQYILGQRSIPTMDIVYAEDVCFFVIVPGQSWEELQKAAMEATNGKCIFAGEEKVSYAMMEKQPVLL